MTAGADVAPTPEEHGLFVLSGSVLTHPARGDAASRVVAQAPPDALSVVTDPDPAGPPTVIRTALAAWESIPASATHHLIVQDDMLLTGTLFERARMAIEAMPAAALALFSLWDSRNGAAVRLGALSGARWVGAVNEYTPCAALILPRDVAAGYVDYVRRHPRTWPEDILMYRYLRSVKVPCLVSVPNLAEHEDVPSIAGNAFRGPRRSACFLRSDRPGGEHSRLTGLTAVPFFKNGVAQCVVRIEGTAPARWLHLETVDYLSGLGVPSRDLQPRLGRPMSGVDPAVVNGTWLTSYAMGMATGNTIQDTDPAVVAEALRTVAAGGMSHDSPAWRISEAQGLLAQVAELGMWAGREAVPRPRRTGFGITVLGGEGPFGEHLVRALTDRGHPVTVVSTSPPGGARPGVRYAITRTHPMSEDRNAVLDLRQLVPGQATAAARTVIVGPRGTGREALRLDAGHLYGPGCGPDSVIGAMVWAALQSKPILISDGTPDVVRPRHVRELAELVCAAVGENDDAPAPAPEYPVRELAEIIAQVVRPTPVHDHRTTTPAAPALVESGRRQGDLRYRLHHFAQWLAYEIEATDPAAIT
ncbi:MAG: hypothetical protein ACRDRK_17245 [Pseudonocardia sp.]